MRCPCCTCAHGTSPASVDNGCTRAIRDDVQRWIDSWKLRRDAQAHGSLFMCPPVGVADCPGWTLPDAPGAAEAQGGLFGGPP